MKITQSDDGRCLVDGQPLVVQTTRDEDGLNAEGADIPEAVLEELLEQECILRAQNQHGEPILFWFDMDGQSLMVEDLDPRDEAIATLEKCAADWEKTASRYANALLGERLIVLDKYERAFSQTVQDGRPTIELKLPGADLNGVTFLSQEQADKVLVELARLCPEAGPFVARDFQEYAKEYGAKTRELIAKAIEIRKGPNRAEPSDEISFAPPGSRYVVLTLAETGNAAFVDAGVNEEVARIIDFAAEKMRDHPAGLAGLGFPLRDLNGNRVGQVEVLDARPADKVGEGAVRLIIETGSAAFDEDALGEVARILREAALAVGNGQDEFSLRDANGNSVGEYQYQVPPFLEQDGVVDMKRAIAQHRVYLAFEGLAGLAHDEYRYVVTARDLEADYDGGMTPVWLVNAKGEVAGGYEDPPEVEHHMFDHLKPDQLSALKDVVEGRVTFEEHERLLNGDDPEPL